MKVPMGTETLHFSTGTMRKDEVLLGSIPAFPYLSADLEIHSIILKFNTENMSVVAWLSFFYKQFFSFEKKDIFPS